MLFEILYSSENDTSPYHVYIRVRPVAGRNLIATWALALLKDRAYMSPSSTRRAPCWRCRSTFSPHSCWHIYSYSHIAHTYTIKKKIIFTTRKYTLIYGDFVRHRSSIWCALFYINHARGMVMRSRSASRSVFSYRAASIRSWKYCYESLILQIIQANVSGSSATWLPFCCMREIWAYVSCFAYPAFMLRVYSVASGRWQSSWVRCITSSQRVCNTRKTPQRRAEQKRLLIECKWE